MAATDNIVSDRASKTKSKSDIRGLFEKIFPTAFFSGTDTTHTPRLMIHDGLVTLQQINHVIEKAREKNEEDMYCYELIDCLKREAEYALKDQLRYPELTDFVICYDKGEFVPIGKGHEHANRATQLTNSGSLSSSANTSIDADNDEQEAPPVQSDTIKRTKGRAKKQKIPLDTTPTDGIPFKQRRPYIVATKPVPRDIGKAISDRDDTRCEIIRNIVSHWIHPESPYRFDIPDGKSVTIDGHCLMPYDVLSFPFENRLASLDGKSVYHFDKMSEEEMQNRDVIRAVQCTPVRLTKHDEVTWSLEWMNELRNFTGEADETMFFIHKIFCQLHEANLTLEISSVDTDIMMLGMIYLEKMQLEKKALPEIIWRYAPNGSWVFYARTPLIQYQKMASLNALYHLVQNGQWTRPGSVDALASPSKRKKTGNNVRDEIDDSTIDSPHMQNITEATSVDEPTETKKRKTRTKKTDRQWDDDATLGHQQRTAWRNLKAPALSLSLALYSVGGDYTDGFAGITYESMFHAYRKYSGYIGNVATHDPKTIYGGNMDGHAYTRLVKVAYAVSMEFKDPENPGSYINPVVTHVKTIQQLGRNKQYKMPSTPAVELNGKQVLYYLKLIIQVGNMQVVDPPAAIHGYNQIDKTKPICRTNIYRQTILPNDYKY